MPQPARFQLTYRRQVLGLLSAIADGWTFRYSDWFCQQTHLRPLIPFHDVDRVYRSATLWPTFHLRIPSRNQPSIQQVIQAKDLDPQNEVQLLRRFARRTITSPFELIDVSDKTDASCQISCQISQQLSIAVT